MVHETSFHAVSGGIAVNSSTFWPEPCVTFTPAGILELAKVGLLPDISEDEIEDKSKADILAKALTCLQAGWFFVQSMARVVKGLPLTLLEIYTLAHIACALSLYYLWLRKPYSVNVPTLYDDPRIMDLAALLISRHGGVFDKEGVEDPIMESELKYRADRARERLRELRFHKWCGEDDESSVYAVHWCTDFFVQGHVRPPNSYALMVDDDFDMVMTLTTRDLFIAFALVSALYGGLHMSAWSAHLPTTVEMWMWRAAYIAVAVFPLFSTLALWGFSIVYRASPDDDDNWRNPRDKYRYMAGSTLIFVASVASSLLSTFYTGGRLYILAEVLASLRSPLVGTYQTVECRSFIPHM